MSDFEVRTSCGSYSVEIGAHIFPASASRCSQVLMDKVLESRFGSFFESWIPFEASEGHKTLAECEQVIIAMNRAKMNRDSSLLAVGGGALQDVATLCSSLYMRGIPWTYAPTTAMAMLDSCIGGKSSINVGGIKNLVGNIHPPRQVIVDVATADTLPLAARVSGLSEAVKICFAGGDALDRYLTIGLTPNEFGSGVGVDKSVSLIVETLRTKRWFVEIDEFDKKERLLLNFGHTFGHALEMATHFRVPHGVAVGLGMLAAIQHPLTVCSNRVADLQSYLIGLLSLIPDTIESARIVDWTRFEAAVLSDKKGSTDSLRLILPTKKSPLAQVDVPRCRESLQHITTSIQQALHMVRT